MSYRAEKISQWIERKQKMVAKKTTGRKMTPAQDHKFDKKYGIKDGSKLDNSLDAKVVKKKAPVKKK